MAGSIEQSTPNTSTCVQFVGRIAQRRCLGRFLAFCELKTSSNEHISVAFYADKLHKPGSMPIKKSQLPYGALIEVSCTYCEEKKQWQVTEWSPLSNPHEEATEKALTVEGGISYTDYQRSRREAFDEVTPRSQTGPKASHKTTLPDKESPHDNRFKAQRAKIFASWMIENLGLSAEHDKVLDVAGGKGNLAIELALQGGLSCTTIDPVVRRRPRKLPEPTPTFVTGYFVFGEETMQEPQWSTLTNELVQSHTCLVGLHPDQCTEAILDTALTSGTLSVAIVPCCVYPDLFGARRLGDGSSVRTYEQFLQYLLEKDPRLRQVQLPFEGKNECIYLKVER